MKLTIIIPVYNGEKYLENCLDSIGKHNDVQIIVIDDGSKDKTVEIAKKFDYITLYQNTNHGVSFSRNYGIKKAKGDYIMFVDADDKLSENWYDKIKNIDDENEIIYISNNIDVHSKKNDLIDYILGIKNPCIGGPFCKVFRRDFLENNNIKFQENIINGEDMLFNLKCLSILSKYMIINDSIYLYRINENSVTRNFNDKIIESDYQFQVQLDNILNEMNLDESEINKYKNICSASGLTLLCDRICYLGKFKNCKEKLKKINIKLYNLDENKLKNISFYKKQILKFLKSKNYIMIYIIYKMKHYRNYKSVKNEYFIKM